jgi:hypothetical protein
VWQEFSPRRSLLPQSILWGHRVRDSSRHGRGNWHRPERPQFGNSQCPPPYHFGVPLRQNGGLFEESRLVNG